MESIGTLAGGIAHDFDDILTGILGFTEIAATSLKPADPSRTALDEVRKAGLRARDLVAQILTFSRQREVRQVPLDLGRAVADALKFLRASSPANIKIERRLAAGTIAADPSAASSDCAQSLHQRVARDARRPGDARRYGRAGGGGRCACRDDAEGFARRLPYACALPIPAMGWTRSRCGGYSIRFSPPNSPAKARAWAWRLSRVS